MSYIGQTLPADTFQGFTTDSFAGDGSATTFTLSKTPFNESALLVVINNVVQKPTTNFTVSGTTLTIVGTAVASSDVIYATHIGGALPIGQAASLDLNGASDQLILDADADTTISADTDDQIDIKVGGTDVVTLTNSSLALKGTTPTLTIGDAGAEDTKIVFDGNAQDFYVGLDDSADDLIIGLGSTVGTTPIISVDENKDVAIPDGGLTITTADNTEQLTLISTDADAASAPHLLLKRDSASPADNDVIGKITFAGENDAGEEVNYCRFRVHLTDVSDGTEDGNFRLFTLNGGAENSRIDIDATETAINEDSADIDFRVESNGNANMLHVDGGNDQVTAGSTSNLSCSLGAYASGERALFVVQVANSDTTAAIWKNVYSQSSQSGTMIAFQNSDNTEVGSIKSTGSATAFNTSSDYRLKENVDYTWDATTRLKQLKPARFNWIADDTNTLEDGFLAHEVSSIVPEAITGTKDAATTLTKAVIGEHGNVIAENIEEFAWTAGKTDGTYDAETTWHASKVNPIYQQIDLGKLVPLLVKTVQEQEARIKALEDA
jgi:hypothetical protein